ncbi:MFS transporter [Flexivirga meconopsidis]|uniref:MFS transporter n=1 Tax=Flexivirga meconopsidis TaxID=2977121 RepID=UPI0022401955
MTETAIRPRADGIRSRAAVPLLAALLFVYLTAEVFPVGALPELAAGLHTGEGEIGLLVSGYAIFAAVVAVPVATLVRRIDRRLVLVGSTLLLAASQFFLAAADNLPMAVLARASSAATHAVVWGGAPVVAARLAPAGREGRATASVFLGTSLGLVLGGPLSAAASQLLGWRPSVLLLGGVAMLLAGLLWCGLPSVPAEPVLGSGSTSRDRRLLVLYAATILLVVAHFVSYPYLAPLVERVGITGGQFTLLLALFGISGFIAVRPVGALIDRAAQVGALAVLGALAAGLLMVATGQVIAVCAGVIAWAVGAVCLPVVLQTAVLRVAADADSASATYVAAYQVGIAAGSALGAVLISAWGAASLPLVSAVVVVAVAVPLLARRSLA